MNIHKGSTHIYDIQKIKIEKVEHNRINIKLIFLDYDTRGFKQVTTFNCYLTLNQVIEDTDIEIDDKILINILRKAKDKQKEFEIKENEAE